MRTGYHSSKQRKSSCVEVKVEGIPATGLIDTGSDITINRGDLFYHIMELTKLDEGNLKPADLKACNCTYDYKPITLDGRIYLHISFGKSVICTTVYVKLLAPDQLLLSEAVCFQLGIVTYHPSVQPVQRCRSTATPRPTSSNVSDSNTVPVEQPRTEKVVKQPKTKEAAQQVTDQPTSQIKSTERGKQPVVTALTSKKSVADKPSESTR